jgi:hypothetical protein
MSNYPTFSFKLMGTGMDAGINMGPLANPRRMSAMQNLVAHAARSEGGTEALEAYLNPKCVS